MLHIIEERIRLAQYTLSAISVLFNQSTKSGLLLSGILDFYETSFGKPDLYDGFVLLHRNHFLMFRDRSSWEYYY